MIRKYLDIIFFMVPLLKSSANDQRKATGVNTQE